MWCGLEDVVRRDWPDCSALSYHITGWRGKIKPTPNGQSPSYCASRTPETPWSGYRDARRAQPRTDCPRRLGILREAFADVRELISKGHRRSLRAGWLPRAKRSSGWQVITAQAPCARVSASSSSRRLLIPGVMDRKSEFHGGRTEVLTGTPGLQLGEPQAGSSES